MTLGSASTITQTAPAPTVGAFPGARRSKLPLASERWLGEYLKRC